MKNILMVAYHYPPIQGSSGVHRTLSFSKYLPRHGWAPTVLTVSRNALMETREANEQLIPDDVGVIRALALDTVEHLSVKGKYPGWLAIPDRWISWLIPAVLAGLWHVLRKRPEVIYSTFPIATAHLVGYVLHRITGVPWVADFRDPMAQDGYPSDPRLWRAYKKIEELAMRHASLVLVCTPGALRFYEARYSSEMGTKGRVIENGYDEQIFGAITGTNFTGPKDPKRIKVLHSGILYPSERDPTQLFEALCALKAEGTIATESFQLVLRSTGYDDIYGPWLSRLGLDDVVELAPSVGYDEAVAEMCTSDALILLQAANCNDQIPAKVYEYFRAGRPILGLTDPNGDTAELLRRANVPWIAKLDSKEEIIHVFKKLIADLASVTADSGYYDPAFVESCSRSHKSYEFAAELDKLDAVRR